MKCPACGFDSADDAAWCDFCKEPFRKAAPPAPGAAGSGESFRAPPPQAPAPAAAPAQRNGKPLVNLDLKSLDPGERIPTIPPWARMAAWAFLGLWAVGGMMLLGYYAAQERRAVESVPLPGPRAPNIP